MRAALFIVFTVFGVWLSLLLGGCATFDQPFVQQFDRGPNVPTKYQYVANGYEMDTLCPKHRDNITLGCAFIPATEDGVCVVVLFPGDAETKEHEDKHCRYGNWHSQLACTQQWEQA